MNLILILKTVLKELSLKEAVETLEFPIWRLCMEQK